MDSEKFKVMIEGFRKQLEAEHLDYVMVIVNHQEDQAHEGIVGIHTDHGIDVPADILFQAAVDGEQAPRHFIDCLTTNVFSLGLNKFVSRNRGNFSSNKSKILN